MKLQTMLVPALIIGLLLPALSMNYYALVRERAALSEELKSYHRRTIEIVALAMQEPIWTMTPVLGEPLLESLMRDPRISLISVRNRKRVFLQRERPERRTGNAWHLTEPIVYQGEEIGTVWLEVDTGQIEQRLSRKENHFLFVTLVQLLLSATLLFHLLQRKILIPINSLSETVSALPYDRSKTFSVTSSNGEFDVLAENLSVMARRFDGQIRQLEDLTRQKDEQLRIRVEQLTALNRVTQTVGSRRDLQSVLHSIACELIEIFDAKTASISMLNAERKALTFMADIVTNESNSVSVRAPLTLENHPELETLLDSRKSAVLNSSEEKRAFEPSGVLLQEGQLCYVMLVPLLLRGKAIGMLHVGTDRQECCFTQTDVEFAETIAGQIIGAIENARLFNEEHHQRQIAESLQQISSILNQSLERNTVLIQIMEQLGRVVNYNGAGIFLREGEHLLVSGARGTASKHLGASVSLISSNPAARVFRSRTSLALADVTTENSWETWEGGEEIRSWIGAPLCIGEKALGVLTVDNFQPGAYSEADAKVLQIFANQAAIAIENARLYELAQEARAEAEQAARAKSMFLSNISHELRTPLNGILGYTQILEESEELLQSRQFREGLAAIERSGTHLMELINDLLDLAKIESQKLELDHKVFHLPEQLDDIAEMIGLQSRQKALEFSFEKDARLPNFVYGDEKRISQVLLNLLNNAVKFTEEGCVVLGVRRLETEKKQHVSDERVQAGRDFSVNEQPLRRILFEVTDSGPGIPEEQMEEIFLPFVQVGDHRQKMKGTGLGLHISQNLLRLMGSELHVESSERQGSKFWFVLSFREAAQYASAPAKQNKRQIVGIKGTPPRILVVDDNRENRKLLLDLLRPLGFHLMEACDGHEALQHAFQWKPELILLDLVLPILDGVELTRRLRESRELNTVKILVVSASSSLVGKDPVAEIGCDDFLMKPIRTCELLERLRRHLELEWVEQEKNDLLSETEDISTLQESCCCPSLSLLQKLLSFAEGGYVTDLRDLLQEIRTSNPACERFASHIEELLDNFLFEQIATLTKNCLENAKTDEHAGDEKDDTETMLK